jgi:uncharacterized protein (DUF2267 family)
MMNISLIPTLESYRDWLKKAKKNLKIIQNHTAYMILQIVFCLLMHFLNIVKIIS